ncbi:hypothetical protein M1307_03890 [Patescibacteria group bacterium]|nr:hypothetical protein [Patescibacteria group bacterium]
MSIEAPIAQVEKESARGLSSKKYIRQRMRDFRICEIESSILSRIAGQQYSPEELFIRRFEKKSLELEPPKYSFEKVRDIFEKMISIFSEKSQNEKDGFQKIAGELIRIGTFHLQRINSDFEYKEWDDQQRDKINPNRPKTEVYS